jgi:large subunit ribosomal protein L18
MRMKNTTLIRKERRRNRVRARISGTAARPRLTVHRSLRGMFVQLIDDTAQKTLCSVSTKDATVSCDVGERTGKTAEAFRTGYALAEKAKAAGITTVVFDRAGFLYHGRVAAVADGARLGGLIV